MTDRAIVIGSRGSRLALAQAGLVVRALEREGRASRISVIETAGDRQAPDSAWGEGAFVAAIERTLLAGRVDVAVHSAKDMPTDEDPRLRIGAYLPRADPRDALVVRMDAPGRRLDDLPPGSRVGTDSPRRTGFLLARRPDLTVHALHGNVDTRLQRLDDGETDALVLACAGLDRIGLGDRIAERIEPDVVPPAPGQGAIAVQARRDGHALLEALAAIDDPDTRRAVEAERAFLDACGGGCRAPIGALGTVVGDELTLLGGLVSPDGSGSRLARRRVPAVNGAALARQLAVTLGGADGVARSVAPRVLVTRAVGQAGELMAALRTNGLEPVAVPAIEVELDPPGGDLDAAARRIDTFAWVVVTSANGARAILEAAWRVGTTVARPRWAVIGAATGESLGRSGIDVLFLPGRTDGHALAGELPMARGERVLVVRGNLAGGEVAASLRARGALVDDVIGYRTHEAPDSSRTVLRRAVAGGAIDAIVFTSGSTVRGLATLAEAEGLDLVSIPAVCIGPGTAAAARAAGYTVADVSAVAGAENLARITARALLDQALEIR